MQYEQKPLDLSSHPVKPRRHRHCSSGDIMHDQGAMQSDGCGPPVVSHTSAKPGGHKHRGPRDIMDLACCMSLQLQHFCCWAGLSAHTRKKIALEVALEVALEG